MQVLGVKAAPRKPGAWIVRAVALFLAGYLCLCGYLFFQQRSLVFQPSAIPLDRPPIGSGLLLLEVAVPELGVIKHWWAPPASRSMPTIIFFHGNAADRTAFVDQAASFRRSGWGVVLASYRGYSGNPGKPSEAGLMADARATIGAVAPHAGPIIIWGHSLGSGIAAQMAAEGRAAGLVLEAPYTSVTDLAAPMYPYVPVRQLLLDRFDTRAMLSRIQVPVLIFHSTDDPQIPFAMGEELADRLGRRATFVRMGGAGHYPHRRDLSDIVARWAQQQHVSG